jgi:DEAD/DEAH box helicase domain-containing protein
METGKSSPPARGKPHVVVFDLETNKLADEVGGWDALRAGAGGISCLVVWDSITNHHNVYTTETLEMAALHLEAADVVISYNGLGFDIPVLEGCIGRRVETKAHLDLLRLIWQATTLRKGNGLDEVGRRTLGRGKVGHGLSAPKLAAQGRWEELITYCAGDVFLTRDLARFVHEHGGVIDQHQDLLRLHVPLAASDWEL